jgi:hypothetical protein
MAAAMEYDLRIELETAQWAIAPFVDSQTGEPVKIWETELRQDGILTKYLACCVHDEGANTVKWAVSNSVSPGSIIALFRHPP